MEPLVHYWSHFVGIYRQTLTKSSKNDFGLRFARPCVVTQRIRTAGFNNLYSFYSSRFTVASRWSTTPSSKVKLHHAINFRALCGAQTVTQHPGIRPQRNPRTATCGTRGFLQPLSNDLEPNKTVMTRFWSMLFYFQVKESSSLTTYWSAFI